MRRILATLFTLTFVTAAAAAPRVTCVSDYTVAGYRQHGCCGQQTAVVAPAGPCCVVSQPSQDRALTESRMVGEKHGLIGLPHVSPIPWFQVSDTVSHPPGRSAGSPHVARRVPIYLEQLSLLI